MSKKIIIALITLLSILSITFIASLVFFIKTDFKFNFDMNMSSNLVMEKQIDNIKDLDINSQVADIKVKEKDINYIKIEIYSENAKEYKIDEEDKIKVVLKEKNKWTFFGKKQSRIEIYVPKEYDKNIYVNSNVGDIKVGTLENALLEVKSDAGDIKVESINKLTSVSNAGDVKIMKVNDVTIKSDAGDIKIENVNNSLNIQSKTGDIKLQNVSINKNSKIKNNVGDVRINKINDIYVDADTNVGDIRVNNQNRKADIVLKIKNNVGDIRVN